MTALQFFFIYLGEAKARYFADLTIHNKKKTESVRSTISTIKEWPHGPTGTNKALYEKIRYHDKKKFGVDPSISTYDDLQKLPWELSRTTTGGDFLRSIKAVGATGMKRLLFISDSGIEILRDAEAWAVDGTFNLAPAPFMQLYMVCGIIGDYTLPAAYAYLPNKDSTTYKDMMTEITQIVGKVSSVPKYFCPLSLDPYYIIILPSSF